MAIKITLCPQAIDRLLRSIIVYRAVLLGKVYVGPRRAIGCLSAGSRALSHSWASASDMEFVRPFQYFVVRGAFIHSN